MKKKALITGITGQDGSYLAKFLLENNYDVVGTSRNLSSSNKWRLNYLNIKNDVKVFKSSYIDTKNISSFLIKNKFTEIYNLSGISSVQKSFKIPISTFRANTFDCLKILNTIYKLKLNTKFYQASSSEMFGSAHQKCNENTPFNPLSPYAISKHSAHQITINYRENYDIFASNGILFNHESPLRGKDFVSKKIIEGLLLIKKNIRKKIKVGNIYSKRDWGHAKDFVKAMYLILNHKKADDFIVTSEKNFTVKDLINTTCEILDIRGKWKGSGLDEYYLYNGRKIIVIDSKLFRPLDIMSISGNSSKARKILKWNSKYTFKGLISEIIAYEKNLFK